MLRGVIDVVKANLVLIILTDFEDGSVVWDAVLLIESRDWKLQISSGN